MLHYRKLGPGQSACRFLVLQLSQNDSTTLNLSPDLGSIYKPTSRVFFPLPYPAWFETTVLQFTALHRPRVCVESDCVVYDRTRSLRMLQSEILHNSKTAHDDLVAVLLLATAERCLVDRNAAAIHFRMYDSSSVVAAIMDRFPITTSWNCFSIGITSAPP
jgi:hypothetical protein